MSERWQHWLFHGCASNRDSGGKVGGAWYECAEQRRLFLRRICGVCDNQHVCDVDNSGGAVVALRVMVLHVGPEVVLWG